MSEMRKKAIAHFQDLTPASIFFKQTFRVKHEPLYMRCKAFVKARCRSPVKSDPILNGNALLAQGVIFSFCTNEWKLFVDREKNQKAGFAFLFF